MKNRDTRIQRLAENYLWDPSEESFEKLLRSINLSSLAQCKKYMIVGHDDDDIKQFARFSVWKAINEYDPNKGSFLAFAKLVTKRFLITHFKSSINGKNRALNKACRDGITLGRSGSRIAEDQEWADGGFDVPALHNLAYDPAELAQIEDQKRDKIEWLKNNLTTMEYKTIFARCNNKGYIRIIDELGLSYKQIDNAIVRARCKARLFFLGDKRSRLTMGK